MSRELETKKKLSWQTLCHRQRLLIRAPELSCCSLVWLSFVRLREGGAAKDAFGSGSIAGPAQKRRREAISHWAGARRRSGSAITRWVGVASAVGRSPLLASTAGIGRGSLHHWAAAGKKRADALYQARSLPEAKLHESACPEQVRALILQNVALPGDSDHRQGG
jgi:hypothetical protein